MCSGLLVVGQTEVFSHQPIRRAADYDSADLVVSVSFWDFWGRYSSSQKSEAGASLGCCDQARCYEATALIKGLVN